jgi:ABC-type nitrate/sulfonate/bicarbonate transport system substrate-binding protein
LQLKWFHLFHFAGYYAAKARGYYGEEGLEAGLRPLDSKRSVMSQVASGEDEHGISDSATVADCARGRFAPGWPRPD